MYISLCFTFLSVAGMHTKLETTWHRANSMYSCLFTPCVCNQWPATFAPDTGLPPLGYPYCHKYCMSHALIFHIIFVLTFNTVPRHDFIRLRRTFGSTPTNTAYVSTEYIHFLPIAFVVIQVADSYSSRKQPASLEILFKLTKYGVEVEIVTKTSGALADIVVLYATWRSSGNVRALARRLDGRNVSLADVLLTDGMSII